GRNRTRQTLAENRKSIQPLDHPWLLVTTECVERPGSRVQFREAWTLHGASILTEIKRLMG
ncbi:MAG: hypothetical protein WD038_02210, partial [Balneolales bacterium]